MVERRQLQEIYKASDPFVIIESKLQSAEGLISELNYQDVEMRDKNRGVFRTVRGSKAHTKRELFDEVSAAFQFPSYFGENWDAFHECMNDLDWLPATNSYLLLVTNADQLLAEDPVKDFEILIDSLKSTAENWASGTNHDILVRAYQAEVVPKTSRFAIVFQVKPGANLENNFGKWISKASIPTIRVAE